MKLALLALFCLEASLAATPSKAVLEDWEVRPEPRYWAEQTLTRLYQAWKQQHGKSYPTNSHAKAELGESFRMKVWMENRAAIEKHNNEFDQVQKSR